MEMCVLPGRSLALHPVGVRSMSDRSIFGVVIAMCQLFRLDMSGAAALLLLAGGCEPASLGTGADPSAPSLDLPAAPAVSEKATVIVLIMPAKVSDSQRAWEQVARAEAGRSSAILEIKQPKLGDPPGRQAELVQEAAEHGASALVVVAEDHAEIASTLGELRDKGVPIILLSRPVPVSGRSLPLVMAAPFVKSARTLVAAAIKDAANVGLSPTGPALILMNNRTDEQSDDRVAALRSALEDAGVTVLDTVRYGVGVAIPMVREAQQAVETAVSAHPDISMILADDDNGLSGAVVARQKLQERLGMYALAGFATNPKTANLVNMDECAAVA